MEEMIMKNEELKKEITDEKTGIDYTLVGDYYLPNLKLEQEEKITLNKYGLLRLDYLKKHKKVELSIMFMNMTLNKHLKEVQKTAQARVNELVKKVIKDSTPQIMNNITSEIIHYNLQYGEHYPLPWPKKMR